MIHRGKGVFVSIVDAVFKVLVKAYEVLTFKWIGKEEPYEIKKILIVNSGYIGDSVLNSVLLHNMRRCYKNAEIHMLVNPKFADLWKKVDKLVFYDAPWIRYGHVLGVRDIFDYFRFSKKLRKEKYGLVVDTRGDFRNNYLLLYRSGAKQRVGFGYTGGSYLLTEDVGFLEGQHEVEKCFSVLEKLGCKIVDKYPILNLDKKDVLEARKILKGLNIAVNPFAGYPTKEWGVDKFSDLVNKLFDKYGKKIVLIGGPKDIDKGKELVKMVGKDKVLNLIGKMKLDKTAALLSECDILIGCDSGPMHIAAAVGCDTIALFGPTDEKRWRPYGKGKHVVVKKDIDCSPCGLLNKCKFGKKCMDMIEVKDVMKEVGDVL